MLIANARAETLRAGGVVSLSVAPTVRSFDGRSMSISLVRVIGTPGRSLDRSGRDHRHSRAPQRVLLGSVVEGRQIRVEQGVAPEQGDDAAEREERPERDAHLPRRCSRGGRAGRPTGRARRPSPASAPPARSGRAWRRAGARASRRPCPSPRGRRAPRGRGRAEAPKRAERPLGLGWSTVCAASTIAAAGSTTTFGTIRCSRSVAETATRAAQKKEATNASRVNPKARKQAATSSAVDELDRRVARPIDVPQPRQRPRRTRYESSGTLSYHASSAAQFMQAEPGDTIERFRGTRAATTFRKLPKASPGASAIAARENDMAAVRRPSRSAGPGHRERRSGLSGLR